MNPNAVIPAKEGHPVKTGAGIQES